MAIEDQLADLERRAVALLNTASALEKRFAAMEKPKVLFASDWKTSPTDGGWGVQAKVPGRATLVPGRYGNAVRLHTEPGDTNIAGSGLSERCDLDGSGVISFREGDEMRMEHSIMFPIDFVPGNGWYVAAAFHNSSNDGVGQANFHVDACRWDRGVLGLRGYGEGSNWDYPDYEAKLGHIVRGLWYDFRYYARWTHKQGGFFNAWVKVENDDFSRQVLAHKGPTLYKDQGVYWKLSCYHEAFGKPTSVVHERVIVLRVA